MIQRVVAATSGGVDDAYFWKKALYVRTHFPDVDTSPDAASGTGLSSEVRSFQKRHAYPTVERLAEAVKSTWRGDALDENTARWFTDAVRDFASSGKRNENNNLDW